MATVAFQSWSVSHNEFTIAATDRWAKTGTLDTIWYITYDSSTGWLLTLIARSQLQPLAAPWSGQNYDVPYLHSLDLPPASGGVPPYDYELNPLVQNIIFTTPGSGSGGCNINTTHIGLMYILTVVVRDQLGSQASGTFNVTFETIH